jgi:hypothetical protein
MSRQKPEEEEFYNVEEILDKKRVGRTHHYLVKWEGYSIKYATWEPKRHLLRVRQMVLDFERKLQNGEIKSLNEPNNEDNSKSLRRKNKKMRKTRLESTSSKEKQETTSQIKEKTIERIESMPLKVLSANKNKENEINFLLEFSNGEKSYLSQLDMRKKYPLLLCNFYESKMIVIK